MTRPELTLILGGARSGKSQYAELLVADYGPCVIFIATAEPKDAEMLERIQIHRAQRSLRWITLEAPRGIGAALTAAAPDADAVLLDCLTVLVSNVVMDNEQEARPTHPVAESEVLEPEYAAAVEAAVNVELDALLEAHTRLDLPLVVVSNEVGMGLVPPYPMGRVYRDALGRANQRLAAIADRVYLLVAGLPMKIKG